MDFKDFSEQQKSAFDKIKAWMHYSDQRQVFRLFGYAGTGKTTIANAIIEELGLRAQFAAFTGKAASVMRQRGCANATTIHSLIYRPVGNSTERIHELKRMLEEAQKENDLQRIQVLQRDLNEANRDARQPNFILKEFELTPLQNADVVVIDEASMVDERMGTDLESYGVKILILGDPAQLPPVKGTGYFTEQKPDVMLTEIHRQAKDNPILMLATLARQGKTLPHGVWGTTSVVQKLDPETPLNVDQVLVGMNKSRIQLNQRMRVLRGYSGIYPRAGERLISLKNDHTKNLLNGSMWVCSHDAEFDSDEDIVRLQLKSEDDPEIALAIMGHAFAFRGEENNLAPWEYTAAHEFYYGDAITVHKAQGSQWSRVLLMNEWKNAATKNRWLYTGITRAQHDLVIYDGYR